MKISFCVLLLCVPSWTLANHPVELASQVKPIVQAARGRVGFCATVLETGESFSYHSRERFPMQSVYKLPIALAILDEIDNKRMDLEQGVSVLRSDFVGPTQHSPLRDAHPAGAVLPLRELLRLAVSESDGSASDVLLRLIGGPPKVMTFLAARGVRGVEVNNTEREIGRNASVQYQNSATPFAMTDLLRALQSERLLSSPSREFLMGLMTATTTGPNRLRGLLPASTIVAHKSGTSRTVDGMTAATNDVGLIALPGGRHLAISIFVSNSFADDATRDLVIARIARLIWDRVGESPASASPSRRVEQRTAGQPTLPLPFAYPSNLQPHAPLASGR